MRAPSKPAEIAVSLRKVDISHAYWLLYIEVSARPPLEKSWVRPWMSNSAIFAHITANVWQAAQH